VVSTGKGSFCGLQIKREKTLEDPKPGEAVCSGVARVPCALGQEIFLRPRQQKLQSLK